MRFDAVDLRLELRDSVRKLGQRIGRKILTRQQCGGISPWAWAIVVIHRQHDRKRDGLLSIRAVATCPVEEICAQIPSDGADRIEGQKGQDMVEAIPPMMQAIGFAEPGGPQVLVLGQIPVPRVGADDVLIRVAHAGVNRPDCIQRQGLYPPPPGASPILGLEVAGTIVDAGHDVPPGLVGQVVAALTPGGGYGEYCVTNWRHCLHVPENMPLAEAAALPETLFTVWHNLFERGYARDGERLLVHGGTSGIGTMAIMLGKAFGLEVIVTCGDEPKCAAARQLGADLAINYRETDFVEAVQAHTAGGGVDVVLDMVSGDYVARNLKCLAEDGRHVTIAVLGGVRAELNMALVMSRRLTLTGSTLRPRSDDFKAALADEIAENAWPLFASGELRPVIDRSFPLAEAAVAHARMEAGEHIGKIVLEVAGD